MALGGGTFTYQNKALPGSYINFVSTASSSSSGSDRGYAAIALPLSWGAVGEIFTVTNLEFYKNSAELFACDYTDDALAGLRDLFLYAGTCYLYRLGSGALTAGCSIASARYPGTRGNHITLVVSEEGGGFCVKTYLDASLKDSQLVQSARELLDNAFVIFDTSSDLEATAGLPLSGGSDGAATAEQYQDFLCKLESYSFNTLGCLSTDDSVKRLFASYTGRMRDEVGVKFQCVLYRYPEADSEGVISVENSACGDAGDSSVVYWVTGVTAGCALNRSNTNRLYDGEFAVDADYTQSELEGFIEEGSFALHRVSGESRVLEDINTLVTVTAEKSSDFSMNQTVRILDQIAVDIASLFCSKYLGVIPNDNAGRISLWNDIVSHHQQLETIRAIEDFAPEHVTVTAGETKKSVVVTDYVTPVCAMTRLYMTVVVN